MIIIKTCLGCGAILQTENKEKDGYTPKKENDYCMRCFKIQNYGAKIKPTKLINNADILKKINKSSKFVIFLGDFLNMYDEVINTFKMINQEKILVLTKADLIPKNIKKVNLIKRIKDIYKIKEDIIITSSKTKENINVLKEIILAQKEVIICGFTNTGKSSLINVLAHATLTISKNANTTLDFLKIPMDEAFIYDSPGFVPKNFLDSLLPKKIIRPVSYQLKTKYYLQVLDYRISSDIDNNFIFFLSNDLKIVKRKIKEEKFITILNLEDNSDVIIKGLGFILIKKKCQIKVDIPKNLIEVRPSIVGGYHE